MIALIMAAGRRPAGRMPLLLAAAALTAGCASGHSERQPASPPATGATPAPIPFARGAYRYTFLATGARFSTNYPGTDDLLPPVSRERVYLVVDGQLANAGARPAPLDVGQPDVGVSIPHRSRTHAGSPGNTATIACVEGGWSVGLMECHGGQDSTGDFTDSAADDLAGQGGDRRGLKDVVPVAAESSDARSMAGLVHMAAFMHGAK